jgi:peroxiredoxin
MCGAASVLVVLAAGSTVMGGVWCERQAGGAGSAGAGHLDGAASAAVVRKTNLWNVGKDTRLGIGGYDPVAYFPEGGGKALKGQEGITLDHLGVVYRFASEANRARFLRDPGKYEPAHGGWCSWAMREGDKVEVDPESFIVSSGRLFLFYKGFWGDTRAKWLAGEHAAEAKEADSQWMKLSGESPRAPMMAARLSEKLESTRAALSQRIPVEQMKVYEEGIKNTAESGVVQRSIGVGAAAPAFELPDGAGSVVSLKSMLAEGPVVVTFYRGAWCPFCAVQLKEYQAMSGAFKAAGARLVAISPQTVEPTRRTAERWGLGYAVLSDAHNAVARQFGIVYRLPDEVARGSVGFLREANGDDSAELPLAATFVVGTDGRVAWAFVEGDYRKRAEPADILAALEKLRSAGK